MDIFKEIDKLPNFAYEFWGHDERYHYVILGGQSCLPPEKCTHQLYWDSILLIHNNMEKVYSAGELSIDEKIFLAKEMKKMMNACFTRLPGIYTSAEQKHYIEGLTAEEQKQISEQIQMYKDCRIFYRDYVHR